MAYHINYSAGKIRKTQFKPISKQLKKKLLIFAAALLASVSLIQTIGADAVKEILLPGDPAVTEAALSGMIEDIRAGERVGDAITAFCREILEGAGVYE